MWSSQSCPRFETIDAIAVAEILHLMPHNDDTLRISIESQSNSGAVRSPHLRIRSMFPDLTFLARAARDVEAAFPCDHQTASMIMMVHRTSDDFTWNAFRAAFKLGFNPKWAHETRALRFALLAWVEDMHFARNCIKLCQGSSETFLNYYRSIGALDAAEGSSTLQEYMLKVLDHADAYDHGKSLSALCADLINDATKQWHESRQPHYRLVVDELIKLARMTDRMSRLVFYLTLFILRHALQSLLEDWQQAGLQSHMYLFPVSDITGYPCI
ncbi:hypothetical protein BDV96DRAFT_229791 [Lophiotrema nucula]|uniref:Uncharacterized protein n=1 Tax=Lophiotrema nucula TaxID=690887 RepID=A0A6A5YSJ6_9PLEO|nr:hypothetical protein BDV96DRAFT_229791 [Lophiotrema nucula]